MLEIGAFGKHKGTRDLPNKHRSGRHRDRAKVFGRVRGRSYWRKNHLRGFFFFVLSIFLRIRRLLLLLSYFGYRFFTIILNFKRLHHILDA